MVENGNVKKNNNNNNNKQIKKKHSASVFDNLESFETFFFAWSILKSRNGGARIICVLALTRVNWFQTRKLFLKKQQIGLI